MGKRLIQQRRGRGGSTYRSPSHRHHGPVAHPKWSGEGEVKDIFRGPGHSAPLARVKFAEGEALMIAPEGLRVGQTVTMGTATIDCGNTMRLKEIPEGTLVFNVEAMPGDGGKFARSAGTAAQVVSHGETTTVLLPSGSFKSLNPECRATVGVISGGGHREKPFAKAGTKFHAYRSKAKRSKKVSGVAMNPVNHPHGGGSHQHVGTPSTVSSHAPPGRKVGRLSPKKKKKGRR
jgi:large subunit ribosomal protein L2